MGFPWQQGLESRLPWTLEVEVPLVGGRVEAFALPGGDAALETCIVESEALVPVGEEGSIIDFIRLDVTEAPTWVTAATRIYALVTVPGEEPLTTLGHALESPFGVGDVARQHELCFVEPAAGMVLGLVLGGVTAPEASAGKVRVRISGRRVF